MSTDWPTMRTEYEVMHCNVKELSERHHVSTSMIQAAIDSQKWERQGAEDMDVEEMSTRLDRAVRQHDFILVPKFITLQSKMLDRCDTLLDDVKSIDDAQNLKIVSDVIEKHRPHVMGVGKNGKEVDTGLTVRILNKVGEGPDVSVSAVEITQKAGETNGIGALTQLN